MGRYKTDIGRNDVAGIFSSARIFHLTSAEVHSKFNALLDRLPKRSNTREHRGYLRGCYDTHVDQLYKDSLEFCYISEEHGIVSTYKKSERYYEKCGMQVSELTNLPNGFYWIGTDKPWFNDEVQKSYDPKDWNKPISEKTPSENTD